LRRGRRPSSCQGKPALSSAHRCRPTSGRGRFSRKDAMPSR